VRAQDICGDVNRLGVVVEDRLFGGHLPIASGPMKTMPISATWSPLRGAEGDP